MLRCLFFVNEVENPAVVQAGQTVTVHRRRRNQDKEPWKNLDLAAINNQTVESDHLFDVHLGETLVPYATLEPLKAVLPLKRGDAAIPTDADGIGGIRVASLDRSMRDRWRTICGLWQQHKTPTNKLDLLGQINYLHKLSAQLEWKGNLGVRPVKVVQTEAGQPTAALLQDTNVMVDSTLYWITCKDLQEASFLLAIINSDAMYRAVSSLMAKGQFGARHVHKHLWKLSIPEFDPSFPLHVSIAKAGKAATAGVETQLEQLRQQRGPKLTVTVARRELRKWLRQSAEGKAVEEAVTELLGCG